MKRPLPGARPDTLSSSDAMPVRLPFQSRCHAGQAPLFQFRRHAGQAPLFQFRCHAGQAPLSSPDAMSVRLPFPVPTPCRSGSPFPVPMPCRSGSLSSFDAMPVRLPLFQFRCHAGQAPFPAPMPCRYRKKTWRHPHFRLAHRKAKCYNCDHPTKVCRRLQCADCFVISIPAERFLRLPEPRISWGSGGALSRQRAVRPLPKSSMCLRTWGTEPAGAPPDM